MIRHNLLWIGILLTGCAGYGARQAATTESPSPAGSSHGPLSAAQTAAKPTPPPAPRLTGREVLPELAGVLDYFRYLHALPGNALTQEYARVQQEDETGGQVPAKQWRLALLLSLSDTSFYDPGRAVSLLKSLSGTNKKRAPLLHELASIMETFVLEQQQDAKKVRTLSEETRTLTGQMKGLQADNKTLQDRLQRLKDIEQSLNQQEKNEATDK